MTIEAHKQAAKTAYDNAYTVPKPAGSTRIVPLSAGQPSHSDSDSSASTPTSIFSSPAAATQSSGTPDLQQLLNDNQSYLNSLNNTPANQNSATGTTTPLSGEQFLLQTAAGNNPDAPSGPDSTYMTTDPKTGNLSLDSGLDFSRNSLKSFDQNKDGKVSTEEAGIMGKNIDLNNDNFISPGENLTYAIKQDSSLGAPDGTVTSKEANAADSQALLDPNGFKQQLNTLYNHQGANGTPSIAQRDTGPDLNSTTPVNPNQNSKSNSGCGCGCKSNSASSSSSNSSGNNNYLPSNSQFKSGQSVQFKEGSCPHLHTGTIGKDGKINTTENIYNKGTGKVEQKQENYATNRSDIHVLGNSNSQTSKSAASTKQCSSSSKSASTQSNKCTKSTTKK